MPTYSVALEDSLYQAFHAFKHGLACDLQKIERLLHLYKPPLITNTHQLKRTRVENQALAMQLTASGLINQSVEELAARTQFKILLSETSSTFPHVNITSDPLGNHYTITCLPGQSRQKLHAHLTALLANAQRVLVHDDYLERNWKSAKRLLTLLPRTPLTLYFDKHTQTMASDIKAVFGNWCVVKNSKPIYTNRHDRYLRIDDAIEIIITSGIDYLFDVSKECTVVIRPTHKTHNKVSIDLC